MQASGHQKYGLQSCPNEIQEINAQTWQVNDTVFEPPTTGSFRR